MQENTKGTERGVIVGGGMIGIEMTEMLLLLNILAEAAGNPYHHLSDKSLKAWKNERWMIHTVLVFITLTTALLWLNSYHKSGVLGSIELFLSCNGSWSGCIFWN
jgi:hypothetical protein